MLACVSTLTEIVSYEDVRQSKEWLTTNEAFCYIRDNCPALFCMMRSRNGDYMTMYNWSLSCKNDYNRKRPKLNAIRTLDNGRREVVFWSVESLNSEEKTWSRTLTDRWTDWRWRNAKDAYLAYLEEKTQAPRGSFYDPEWFQ